MKVRTITVGVELSIDDFTIQENDTYLISKKLAVAKSALEVISKDLITAGYEVQTQRVSLNSFEDWLMCKDSLKDIAYYITIAKILDHHLELIGIDYCAIGCCSSLQAISLVPALLAVSDRFYSSVLFKKTILDNIAPDLSLISKTSEALLEIVNTLGVIGCFRFCASFNCSSGTPFFPAAFYEKKSLVTDEESQKEKVDDNGYLVSIGLECADLLFISFNGADSVSDGSRNLTEVMKQAILPIQNIVSTACNVLKIEYGGIDASINPGLSLPDSVGAGLENLLFFPQKQISSLPPLPFQKFGEFGTLAAISAVTNAVKSLANNGIKLIGYNGVMLPVMEDLILADRAAQDFPTFSLRDLLVFSSVCGVGLDTVPVPGNITAETVSGVFMETAALAFRLNKPLSCRLLPMVGLRAGDMTDITHDHLVNTRVFSV